MKIALGLPLGLVAGAVRRLAGIPVPAPPALVGAASGDAVISQDVGSVHE